MFVDKQTNPILCVNIEGKIKVFKKEKKGTAYQKQQGCSIKLSSPKTQWFQSGVGSSWIHSWAWLAVLKHTCSPRTDAYRSLSERTGHYCNHFKYVDQHSARSCRLDNHSPGREGETGHVTPGSATTRLPSLPTVACPIWLSLCSWKLSPVLSYRHIALQQKQTV